VTEKEKNAKKKILIIYDIDDNWWETEKREVYDSVKSLKTALLKKKFEVEDIEINRKEDLTIKLKKYSNNNVLIFNWCESIPGLPQSEWKVPDALEKLGFAYTGSSADVLKLSYDKYRTIEILKKNNIDIPFSKVYEHTHNLDWNIYPAIVKSAVDHCSLGISPKSVVFNNDELKERIDYYLKNYNQPALVEVFIDGREFHVSVLGNEIIEVLPIAEMDYSKFEDIHDRLCTYESKFVPGSKHYSGIETLLPAPLTNDEFRKIIEVSKLSFKILGCRDYARIDIRMLDNKIYVLDVNPNPDISADASMACAAEFLGMDYSDFIEKLVNITIDRYSAASAKLKK